MRHGKMKAALRYNMFNNMTISLINHGRIRTTLGKAKVFRPFVEKIITKAKNLKDSLSFRREMSSIIRDPIRSKEFFEKLCNDVESLFKDRNGGYTRIYKIGKRYGDCAEEALIELVGFENLDKSKSKKDKE